MSPILLIALGILGLYLVYRWRKRQAVKDEIKATIPGVSEEAAERAAQIVMNPEMLAEEYYPEAPEEVKQATATVVSLLYTPADFARAVEAGAEEALAAEIKVMAEAEVRAPGRFEPVTPVIEEAAPVHLLVAAVGEEVKPYTRRIGIYPIIEGVIRHPMYPSYPIYFQGVETRKLYVYRRYPASVAAGMGWWDFSPSGLPRGLGWWTPGKVSGTWERVA